MIQNPMYGNYQPMYPNPFTNNIYRQQPSSIPGKVVASFNEITASDIPMDGSISVFVSSDLSQVQARQWKNDGTIKIVQFEPKIIEPNNLPLNEIKSENGANLSLADAFETINAKLETLLNRKTECSCHKTEVKKDAD